MFSKAKQKIGLYGRCYQHGARRNFCSIKNKHALFPSFMYPFAIVGDFVIRKLQTLLSCVINVCHREQKSEEHCRASLKRRFPSYPLTGYLARCCLILRSGGKCTLCHSIILHATTLSPAERLSPPSFLVSPVVWVPC